MSVSFHVEGMPRPQGSKTAGINRQTGQPFMRESNAKLLTPWRKAVRTRAKDCGIIPFTGGVKAILTFSFDRPKSHGDDETQPTGRQFGDLDKLTRAVLDAITGPILVDDCQVVKLTATKRWAYNEPGHRQGVHVWIDSASTPTGSPY